MFTVGSILPEDFAPTHSAFHWTWWLCSREEIARAWSWPLRSRMHKTLLLLYMYNLIMLCLSTGILWVLLGAPRRVLTIELQHSMLNKYKIQVSRTLVNKHILQNDHSWRQRSYWWRTITFSNTCNKVVQLSMGTLCFHNYTQRHYDLTVKTEKRKCAEGIVDGIQVIIQGEQIKDCGNS
jgi:hypothetical protein